MSWATNIGVKFDRTQTQDLYNFVKSGYTSARTVDARIQSRKGGTDNPRIAWYESYELGKDNVFVTKFFVLGKTEFIALQSPVRLS